MNFSRRKYFSFPLVPPEPRNTFLTYWLPIGMAGMFLALRLYHLGYHDFWYDEACSVSYARYPWGNWNAPLYWILLHFWVKLFGTSEFALRFPSALYSFLATIVVYLLGRRLGGRQVAVIASICIGCSAFHLWYAQEARDYSLVLLWGLLATYFLYRAFDTPGIRYRVLFVLASVAGLYTNYFYIFLFAGHCLWLTFSGRQRIKTGILLVAAALCFLPYLQRFMEKFSVVQQGFWVPKPTLQSLLITLENSLLGFNGSFGLYALSNIVMEIVLLWSVYCLFRRPELRRKIILPALLSAFPVAGIFIFSRSFFPVYLDRAFLLFTPYFYLVLATAIVAMPKALRLIFGSLIVGMAVASSWLYHSDYMVVAVEHRHGTYLKMPVKPTVRLIEAYLGPDDIIAFSNESMMAPFEFYRQKKSVPLYYFFDQRYNDTTWLRPRRDSPGEVSLPRVAQLKFKRAWVIGSNWARNGSLDERSEAVREWLDQNLDLQFRQEFDGILLSLYLRKP